MSGKAKAPRKPANKPPAERDLPPRWQETQNQEAARWQRTVRYGWDKGGAKGGRR